MSENPSGYETRQRMMWAAGITIGVGTGVAFGTALNNMALGVAIGIGIGVVFALVFGRSKKPKAPKPDAAPEEPTA